MHVIESDQIKRGVALAIRHGSAVLVIRQGLLSDEDFALLRALLSCVSGKVAPGVMVAGATSAA